MKDNHYLHTKSKKHPSIDIRDNVSRLGIRKLQALVGLHKFSVSDWGEKFVGIQKPTWIKRFLIQDSNDSIARLPIILDEGEISKSLVDDELPS